MKALELANLEEEVASSSDLSPTARETLLSWIRGYPRLRTGRRQMAVIRYIESALSDGFPLYDYAIPTAAQLFNYQESTVRDLWYSCRENTHETPDLTVLSKAS